jgi:3-oxoacyl-[acyl-carrier-protein] synthase III
MTDQAMSGTRAQRLTFINAIAYELGEEVHNIDDLTHVLPGTLTRLHEGGLEKYCVTTRTPIELARGPVEQTLAAAGVKSQMINRVIFATNSFDNSEVALPAGISALMAANGLPRVFPIGTFLAFCANFQSALELARALIESYREDCVLVVCTDVLAPERDRIVEPKISVHSDAAVSFLLSADEGPYRLIDTRLRSDAKLGALNRYTQFVQYMDGVSRNVVGLIEDMVAASDFGVDDVAVLLPNNYNRWVCRSMAELVGFDSANVFMDNIPRFAHALAADNAINLVDAHTSGRVKTGDLVAMLGSGAFQWGCTMLRVE